MKKINAEAAIKHTEYSLERLYKTQYYSYERSKYYAQLAIGFGMAAFALLGARAMWLKAVLLFIGAMLISCGDLPGQLRADKALQARGGSLPEMRYQFYEKHFSLSGEGSMNIQYQKLERLVEDEQYLYLFLSRDSVCMLDRQSVRHMTDRELMELLKEKTGLHWTKEKPILSLNLWDLRQMRKERREDNKLRQ